MGAMFILSILSVAMDFTVYIARFFIAYNERVLK